MFASHGVRRTVLAVAAAEDDAVGGCPFDAVGVPFACGIVCEDAGVGHFRFALHAVENRHDHAPRQREVLAELGSRHGSGRTTEYEALAMTNQILLLDETGFVTARH